MQKLQNVYPISNLPVQVVEIVWRLFKIDFFYSRNFVQCQTLLKQKQVLEKGSKSDDQLTTTCLTNNWCILNCYHQVKKITRI